MFERRRNLWSAVLLPGCVLPGTAAPCHRQQHVHHRRCRGAIQQSAGTDRSGGCTSPAGRGRAVNSHRHLHTHSSHDSTMRGTMVWWPPDHRNASPGPTRTHGSSYASPAGHACLARLPLMSTASRLFRRSRSPDTCAGNLAHLRPMATCTVGMTSKSSATDSIQLAGNAPPARHFLRHRATAAGLTRHRAD